MKKVIIVLVCALCFSFFAGMQSMANATNLAVINGNEIMGNSNPAKAGETHLQRVQEVLRSGMNEVLAMYQGKEETDEAKRMIADAYNKLNQQMAVEQQAVRNVLSKVLADCVKEWRASNKKIEAVMDSNLFWDYADKLDATDAVLKIYNTKNPVFPDLPQVTVRKPEDAPKN